MTYKVTLQTWGAECIAGSISDKIWKYIEEECDGDINEYRDRLDDLPEDLKLMPDIGSGYDGDDQFFDVYSAYSDCQLTVSDENDNDVCVIEDISKDKDITIEDDVVAAPAGHVYIWQSLEKGYWTCNIEVPDGETFDKKKLKVQLRTLSIDGDEKVSCVYEVEYDETPSDGIECANSRGISFELDSYTCEDQDEEEQ